MAISTIKKSQAIAAVGTNKETLGAVTEFTPTRDAWCVIYTVTGASLSNAPVVRVNNNGNVVAETTGAQINKSANHTALPVKAGETYSISVFRTEIINVWLYY